MFSKVDAYFSNRHFTTRALRDTPPHTSYTRIDYLPNYGFIGCPYNRDSTTTDQDGAIKLCSVRNSNPPTILQQNSTSWYPGFFNKHITKKFKKPFSFIYPPHDGHFFPENSQIAFLTPDISKNWTGSSVCLIPDPYIMTHNFALTDQLSSQFPLANRVSKAMWRGNQTKGHYNIDTYKSIPRSRLVWMSLEHPDELDARFVNYKCQSGNDPKSVEYQELMEKTFGPAAAPIPYHDMLQYKFLVSLDGNVAAWRRPAQILSGGSILLYHTNYEQYFNEHLKEGVHYIGINEDLSDLIEKIKMLRAHPELCESISQEAQKISKEIFSQEFIVSYFHHVFERLEAAFEDISEEDFIREMGIGHILK